MVRKYFDIETKVLSESERTVGHWITREVVDRDGEIVLVDGGVLDNFNKNPVVLWAHGYDLNRGFLPIGKNLALTKSKKDGIKGIWATTKFYDDDFSKNIWQMYKEGYLKTFSIGFIPKDRQVETITEDSKERQVGVFKAWELLEYSSVPVPANPEASVRALQKGLISKNAFEFWEKIKNCDDNGIWKSLYEELQKNYATIQDEHKTMQVALNDMTHQRDELLRELTNGHKVSGLSAIKLTAFKQELIKLLDILQVGNTADSKQDDNIGKENPKSEPFWFKWGSGKGDN